MKSGFTVLIDACVLVPMPLTDTLLRLAAGPRLYLPKYSDQIMVHVSLILQKKFNLSPQKGMDRKKRNLPTLPEGVD